MTNNKNHKILVVDDEAIIRDLLQDILDLLGYDSILTGTPYEAIELFKANQDVINVILLDMIMPQMNGRQLFRELKCIKPGIKGILLSGYSLEGEVEKSLSEGITDFMQKPVSIKALSEVLEKVICTDIV